MRAFFWLWAMFLLVCLTADAASYWVMRNRLSQGLDLALDAAIVGSIEEEDLSRGRQLSQKARAGALAWEILQKNLAGPLASGLRLDFELIQGQEQIEAAGRAKITLPFLLAGVTGGGREITVNKKLAYQGLYK